MVFGNQDNRLLEIQNGTEELEDEGESRELTITERSKLINSLVTERNVEAIWRQKSRQNWCKLGDRNTRFFHLAAGMRRWRNSTISKIIYGTMRTTITSPSDMKAAAASFHSNLLFTRPNHRRAAWEQWDLKLFLLNCLLGWNRLQLWRKLSKLYGTVIYLKLRVQMDSLFLSIGKLGICSGF